VLAIPRGRAGLRLCMSKRALIEKLDEILREKNIQRPIDGDTHLLFGPGQFAPVNSAPEKPRQKPGKIHTENTCDTCAATDRSKRAKRFKAKRLFWRSVNGRNDIARDNFTLTRCVLRGRRTVLACRWIRNERAITQRPEPIHTFHFQV